MDLGPELCSHGDRSPAADSKSDREFLSIGLAQARELVVFEGDWLEIIARQLGQIRDAVVGLGAECFAKKA